MEIIIDLPIGFPINSIISQKERKRERERENFGDLAYNFLIGEFDNDQKGVHYHQERERDRGKRERQRERGEYDNDQK